MIQLVAVAAAFLMTLFMILGGIANIQDNLGEYRRQLDAEGFEGISIGYVNQAILREGGLLPFLRQHCPTDATKGEFNPEVRVDCFNDAGVKSIFGISRRLTTNELREAQSIDEIKGDSSEIQFEFALMKPGADLWQFAPIAGDTRVMSLSYLEVTATVFLRKSVNGEETDVHVFQFKRIFRP